MIKVDNWEQVTICDILTGKTECIVVDHLVTIPAGYFSNV